MALVRDLTPSRRKFSILSRKLFQCAPSPSNFHLSSYFWIHITCGIDIRDLFGSLVTHYRLERVNSVL